MPDPTSLTVPLDRGASTTALIYPSHRDSAAALILAHGAGAGQRSPFMVSFARALSERGLDVVTFNFLYTERLARRSLGGGGRVPDRLPQLVACYRAVVATVCEHLAGAGGWRPALAGPSANSQRLFIGGKSMGGRVATHVAADDPALPGSAIRGIVLLGYPLHPPGRPDQLRDAHLPRVGRPMLFVQGSRDAFGTPSELKPIFENISPSPTLHAIDGGDHSFKLTGRDANRQAAIYSEIQDTIVGWIDSIGT